MRAAEPRGQHRRARRFQRDDPVHPRAERLRDADQHPAGAHRRAEHAERSTGGLVEDLAAEHLVAVQRVEIVELVGPEGVLGGDDPVDLVPHPDEQVGRDPAPVTRHHDEVRAERLHRAQLLRRERVRRDHCQRVALDRADERERRPGTAAGELDHPSPGPQYAASLGALDHRERHPVLVAAGRVAALELHQHLGRVGWHDAPQPHQRGVADRLQCGGEDHELSLRTEPVRRQRVAAESG